MLNLISGVVPIQLLQSPYFLLLPSFISLHSQNPGWEKKDAYSHESNLPSFDSAILIFFLFPISLHHVTS